MDDTASLSLSQPPARPVGRARRLARLLSAQWQRVPRTARQACVLVLGTVVLLAGAAMIVLPGPAILVIPLGFAILATEFRWARKLVDGTRARLQRLGQSWRGRRRSGEPPQQTAATD